MDTESLVPPEKLQNFTLGWGFLPLWQVFIKWRTADL